MTPLTSLLILSAFMGLAFAGMYYERPEEQQFESEDARSYMQQDAQGYMQQDAQGDMQQDAQGDMQQDAQGYMELDPEGYVQQDNTAVYEEDNDVAEVEVHYQNEWDSNLHLECSSRFAIFKFQSIHDNRKEDRKWRFDCKKVASYGTPNCRWNYGINTWDLPMFFMCPANYYLAGVRSRHDNKKEDRIWDAKCCYLSNRCTKNCKMTGYVNNWDQPLHYSSTGVFAGLLSYHDNKKEDRLWKVIDCDYSRC